MMQMILMELEIKVGFPIKNLKTGLKMRRLTLFDVFILSSCSKDSPIPDAPTPSVTYPLSVSAAGTYYYQCSVQDVMYGTITVQ